MLYQLPNNTECTLTRFVGRTQKAGKEDVPAVSFRLKRTSVSNVVLDMFSKTMRHTVYEAVPGQEQLPGIEITTPILRSKDLKHWAPEDLRCDGWTVIIARGIDDDSALQMRKCKLDDFRFDLFEGGSMDYDHRVSTADLDEEGAGMLWGRQEQKVFVTIIAPEVAPAAIDGSTEAFKADHPESTQADLLDDATHEYARLHGNGHVAEDEMEEGRMGGDGYEPDAGGPVDSDSDTDAGSKVAWPFPGDSARPAEPAPQSVTIEQSQPGTQPARGRAKTKSSLEAGHHD